MLTAVDLASDDPERFKLARDGDHLMCPFQCDDCHFQNLNTDGVLLLCIRRANLDALWVREPTTVHSNRREGARLIELSKQLGLENPYPRRGPYPVKDSFGKGVAAMMLMRSLDTGKNAKTIQYKTMRKLRGHYSNFVHTTPDGVGASTTSSEGASSFVSHSETNSYWFKRFMHGCHKRMGDVWIPDRPLTMEELLCVQSLLEEDWRLCGLNDNKRRLKIALTGVSLTSGFAAGLRGEEIPRIELGLIRKYWKEAQECATPHVPLAMAGRFKQHVGENQYFQPLANVTVSGVNIGVSDGPMFRLASSGRGAKVKRCAMGDLNPAFHALLKRVQDRWPNVIPASVDVQAEYDITRSKRRGVTAHAQNQCIPKEVIEANNRWRKHERARGMRPGMFMMEHYSDAKASVKMLVRFSQGL
jgi:hypothetical protein